nr:hypothetical protein [Brenneria goodwinii]
MKYRLSDTAHRRYITFFDTATYLAAAAIYARRNSIAVSGKFATATPGTSWASKLARQRLQKYKLPFPLPAIIGNPFKMKVIMTHKLGTFVGRSIPSGILKAGVIGGKGQSGTYKLDARFKKRRYCI